MVLSVTDYVATHSCVIVTPLQPEIGVRSGREAKSRRAARRHNTPHTTQHHKLSFARLATTRSVQAGVLAAPILHAHAQSHVHVHVRVRPQAKVWGASTVRGGAAGVHAGSSHLYCCCTKTIDPPMESQRSQTRTAIAYPADKKATASNPSGGPTSAIAQPTKASAG